MASETGSSQIVGEIGRSRRPLADERLVRGEGQYVGDIRLPGLLHLALVRSSHASARLRRVAVEAAAAADGVALVLTGADVVDPEDAIAEGAPLVHPEFGTNRALTWHRGSGVRDRAPGRGNGATAGPRRDRVTSAQLHPADGFSVSVVPGHAVRLRRLRGGALATVADEVYQWARRTAGHLLEAAPEDVTAQSGRFSVAGVNAAERSVSWAEVAAAAQSGTLPPELDARLDVQTRFDLGGEAFAFGTCIAVVEVERSTGLVRLRRLALVHDCGTQINPHLVEAQLHGGLAQGAGEALGEWLRYDENGQLLAGSLLDYWLPHADELPSFELASTITASPLNPLGAKGVGQAGTIAAPPAILHAVLDALRPLGVRSLDLPLSPERVWQAMQDAEGSDHEAH